MKLVHSAATLSHVHSNIWMMTDLAPDGALSASVPEEDCGADLAHWTKVPTAKRAGEYQVKRMLVYRGG